MRTTAAIIAAVAVLSGRLVAQEQKPAPKDSVRVSIPGCTKGYIFTAGRRTLDEPGSVSIPEGMHFRMTGPKKWQEFLGSGDRPPLKRHDDF